MLQQIAVFLCAAVVLVPLFHRLGLGSVLGYLVAGIVLGPWALGVASDVDAILHFSELGVALLLFVIGLELQPSRLWVLRRPVFGLGGAQVLLTTLLIGAAALAAGAHGRAATVIGIGLALSSTAFVLQTLAERRELGTRQGREAFAVLLFQDLVVIPVLAVLPLLAPAAGGADAGIDWLAALRALALVGALVVVGRWVLEASFAFLARTSSREIFTAAALLAVFGTAWLATRMGLSASLGAFIAGVLLSNSPFRHEIEADLESFKGLLLGLFFMAVGMSVNVGLLAAEPLRLLGYALGLMVCKFAIVFLLARLGGAQTPVARALGVALASGGEFAFVIVGLGRSEGLLDTAAADAVTVVVTLSMMLAPLGFLAEDWYRRRSAQREVEPVYDRIDAPGNPVVLIGFGRFGQIIARVLRVRGIAFTALDASAEQVEFVRRFGSKVYYGDASRRALLRAAKVDEARVVVLAVDDVEASLRIAGVVRRHYPAVPVYARARNRQHCYRLMDLGVRVLHRDTFLSSLAMARDVLCGLGLDAREAERTVATFRAHDEALLERQYAVHHDEAALMQSARETAEELRRIFEDDAAGAPR